MNKTQLIDALAARYAGNRKAAAQALDAVIDTITREVARGEKVAITGFGSFEKRVREARTVRNPRTGEKIQAKKTAVPKFNPGADLKAVVSGAKQLPALTFAVADSAVKTAAAAAVKATPGGGATRKSTATKSSPAKKATGTTAATKKSAAKKSTSTASTAKKSTAKKSTAKKSPAAAKKTSTSSSGAKKASSSPAKKTSTAAAKKTSTSSSGAKKASAKKST